MYKGTKVLDVHGHVSAPSAGRAYVAGLMAANTAGRSPIASGFSPAQGRNGLDLSREAFMETCGGHAAYMDHRNIDTQIIGPRPFLTLGFMEPHLLPSWVNFVNDTIRIQCELFQDRFLGAAMLPQISDAPDLSNCVPVMERCVNEYGFVAAYVSPDPAGRRTTPGMHEAYWYPVYEKAQELGIPLIVHGTNCLDPRIRILPQNYQIGFVVEQFIATQLLSHSDVFERFPELRVIVCHCGGALDRFIPTDNHLAQKDLSKNLFFDTCGYDVHFLEAAIKQRGISQTCFGTEAPGSGGAVRPETGETSDNLVPIIDGFDFLSEEDKLTIFHRNPLRVVPQFARVAD
ncbi:MAG: amidohydrolase family protein [Dehalococcoidia bacterium]